MTVDEMTPADCDNLLEDAKASIDDALTILSHETAFGYNVVSRMLVEIQRSIREAQADLTREIARGNKG